MQSTPRHSPKRLWPFIGLGVANGTGVAVAGPRGLEMDSEGGCDWGIGSAEEEVGGGRGERRRPGWLGGGVQVRGVNWGSFERRGLPVGWPACHALTPFPAGLRLPRHRGPLVCRARSVESWGANPLAKRHVGG